MDRLFFDTNVILDVLEERAPWFPEAAECLALVREGRCAGAVTAITLSDIAYIQRPADTARVYATFVRLLGFLEIASVDQVVVEASLHRELADIEDGFQLEAARQWHATYLLTRNVKDFPTDAEIRVLPPAEYLEHRGLHSGR
ncbi:MAG: type II toxin-antitoxin system VapC family toxin [Opitutales bacterium]